MKTHEMRLNDIYFDQIKSGKKDIEYRLNDEKRQLLKIGDHIIFYKRPEEKETITVKVVGLKTYHTLLEMYQDTFDRFLKDTFTSPEEVVKATTYYSAEEVEKYGCLAIFIQKIENEKSF